jgi:hypothetical protein
MSYISRDMLASAWTSWTDRADQVQGRKHVLSDRTHDIILGGRENSWTLSVYTQPYSNNNKPRTQTHSHHTATAGGGGKVVEAPTGVRDAGAGGGGAARFRSFRVPPAKSTCM